MSDGYVFDHVAILVPSLERSLEVLSKEKYPVEPIDVFEEGGTREVYIGLGSKGSLLLIQPTHSTWHQRYLQQHGFGLHHVSISVPSIIDYCESLEGKGWYLHTASAYGLEKLRTVYLVQPATRLMIETQIPPRDVSRLDAPFVSRISVPVLNEAELKTMTNLGVAELRPSTDKEWVFRVGSRDWLVSDIVV